MRGAFLLSPPRPPDGPAAAAAPIPVSASTAASSESSAPCSSDDVESRRVALSACPHWWYSVAHRDAVPANAHHELHLTVRSRCPGGSGGEASVSEVACAGFPRLEIAAANAIADPMAGRCHAQPRSCPVRWLARCVCTTTWAKERVKWRAGAGPLFVCPTSSRRSRPSR
jgi:hypothetical protein